MKKLMMMLVALAAGVACRDVSRSPAGPSFAVAADSGGVCDASKCHFNSRGQSAYVNWFGTSASAPAADSGGGGGDAQVVGYVNVSRNTDQTFLYYGIMECRYWGCTTVAGGYGTIPNADLSGNGKSTHLSTNTSGNPGFFTYAGPSGPIEITWTPNGLFEYHSNGTTQMIQPGFTQRQTGQSDDASATATGAVISYAILAGNSATMSSNHQVSITINR